jgi:hypothetical protein
MPAGCAAALFIPNSQGLGDGLLVSIVCAAKKEKATAFSELPNAFANGLTVPSRV